MEQKFPGIIFKNSRILYKVALFFAAGILENAVPFAAGNFWKFLEFSLENGKRSELPLTLNF